MNQLVLSADGFPAYNKTWEFLQSSYTSVLSAVAKGLAKGNHIILSGMEDLGDELDDGFLMLNGEIIPFVRSHKNVSGKIAIFEDVENEDYRVDINDDSVYSNLPAYKTRYAKFDENEPTVTYLHILKRIGDINFLGQFPSGDSIPFLICAGAFSYAGARGYMRGASRVPQQFQRQTIKFPFVVEKLASGDYRITHNYGDRDYYVVANVANIIDYRVQVTNISDNTCDLRIIGDAQDYYEPGVRFSIFKINR